MPLAEMLGANLRMVERAWMKAFSWLVSPSGSRGSQMGITCLTVRHEATFSWTAMTGALTGALGATTSASSAAAKGASTSSVCRADTGAGPGKISTVNPRRLPSKLMRSAWVLQTGQSEVDGCMNKPWRSDRTMSCFSSKTACGPEINVSVRSPFTRASLNTGKSPSAL